ncbi:MAG: hypothetical protein ABW137_15510, partial [Mycobacterium sp.]
ESGPLAFIGSADHEFVGVTIVGLFVVVWLIALAVWRFGRIEERWDTDANTAVDQANAYGPSKSPT